MYTNGYTVRAAAPVALSRQKLALQTRYHRADCRAPAAAWRPAVAALRALMTARYLAAYRRARGIDRDRLPYYEAAACMRGLVRAGHARLVGDRNALDASSYGPRLAARFARVSGVAVSLPPWRD